MKLGWLCALILVHSASAMGSQEELAALASPDADLAREAALGLRRLGSAGERALWVDFSTQDPVARRARARWALSYGTSLSTTPAAEALIDPDPLVRTLLVRLIGKAESDGDARAALLATLENCAEFESSRAVRAEIVEALAGLGGAEAAQVMISLARVWPAPERTELAVRIAGERAARIRILELVPRALEPATARRADDPARLPEDVVAALLPAYGRALADLESGGTTARERAPLRIGLRHPSPEVRRGARLALEEWIAGLRLLGRSQRADRLLAALAAEAEDPRPLLHRRALHALQAGLATETALKAVDELERLARFTDRREDRRWRFRAEYLRAVIAIVDGDSRQVEPSIVRAAGLLEGLLAERADLATEAGREDQHELLHQLALLELLRIVEGLIQGRGVNDPGLLERARKLHEIELRAQVLAAEADLVEVQLLDILIETSTSPLRLVFSPRRTDDWPVEQRLRIEAGLARVLATIAPLEMIGFEPLEGALEGRADPQLDPVRKQLILDVIEARAVSAQRTFMDAKAALQRRARRGETIGIEDEQYLQRLDMRRRGAEKDKDDSIEEKTESVRSVSKVGLRFARSLRDEGRTREARELCRRMLDAIEARQLAQSYPGVLQLAAEIQIAIASAWTADGEGVKAEDELEGAIERLEALEALLVERGAQASVANVRTMRADALLSMAVNANVGLEDPERALEVFEQAYELRQDDFMRVLLACYRARSGRHAEARALLADVPVAPPYFYNLGCTWALLGERERALDMIERELKENHPSEASRRQQERWARRDPDLVSLRDDPRFRFLVGEPEEGGDRDESSGGKSDER